MSCAVITALLVRAPCGAIVHCERSSDDIGDDPIHATWRAPGRRDLVHITIAQWVSGNDRLSRGAVACETAETEASPGP